MIKPISYSFHAFVRNRKISKLCRKNHLHLDIWGEYFVDDSTQSFWIIFEVGCNCYKIDQVHLTQFRSNFDVKHAKNEIFDPNSSSNCPMFWNYWGALYTYTRKNTFLAVVSYLHTMFTRLNIPIFTTLAHKQCLRS